jgi:hypothetical protein
MYLQNVEILTLTDAAGALKAKYTYIIKRVAYKKYSIHH